jgi:hypothetical protein
MGSTRYQAYLDGTLEMVGGSSTILQIGIGAMGTGSVQLMQDSIGSFTKGLPTQTQRLRLDAEFTVTG